MSMCVYVCVYVCVCVCVYGRVCNDVLQALGGAVHVVGGLGNGSDLRSG